MPTITESFKQAVAEALNTHRATSAGGEAQRRLALLASKKDHSARESTTAFLFPKLTVDGNLNPEDGKLVNITANELQAIVRSKDLFKQFYHNLFGVEPSPTQVTAYKLWLSQQPLFQQSTEISRTSPAKPFQPLYKGTDYNRAENNEVGEEEPDTVVPALRHSLTLPPLVPKTLQDQIKALKAAQTTEHKPLREWRKPENAQYFNPNNDGGLSGAGQGYGQNLADLYLKSTLPEISEAEFPSAQRQELFQQEALSQKEKEKRASAITEEERKLREAAGKEKMEDVAMMAPHNEFHDIGERIAKQALATHQRNQQTRQQEEEDWAKTAPNAEKIQEAERVYKDYKQTEPDFDKDIERYFDKSFKERQDARTRLAQKTWSDEVRPAYEQVYALAGLSGSPAVKEALARKQKDYFDQVNDQLLLDREKAQHRADSLAAINRTNWLEKKAQLEREVEILFNRRADNVTHRQSSQQEEQRENTHASGLASNAAQQRQYQRQREIDVREYLKEGPFRDKMKEVGLQQLLLDGVGRSDPLLTNYTQSPAYVAPPSNLPYAGALLGAAGPIETLLQTYRGASGVNRAKGGRIPKMAQGGQISLADRNQDSLLFTTALGDNLLTAASGTKGIREAFQKAREQYHHLRNHQEERRDTLRAFAVKQEHQAKQDAYQRWKDDFIHALKEKELAMDERYKNRHLALQERQFEDRRENDNKLLALKQQELSQKQEDPKPSKESLKAYQNLLDSEQKIGNSLKNVDEAIVLQKRVKTGDFLASSASGYKSLDGLTGVLTGADKKDVQLLRGSLNKVLLDTAGSLNLGKNIPIFRAIQDAKPDLSNSQEANLKLLEMTKSGYMQAYKHLQQKKDLLFSSDPGLAALAQKQSPVTADDFREGEE